MRELRGHQLRMCFGVATSALTLWASVAWACTPGASLDVNPHEVTAGSTVRLTGSEFEAGDVQVFLESTQGGAERLLWQGRGPKISADVVVPADLAPGSYALNGHSAGGQGLGLAVLTVIDRTAGDPEARAPEGSGQPTTGDEQGAPTNQAAGDTGSGKTVPAEEATAAAAETKPPAQPVRPSAAGATRTTQRPVAATPDTDAANTAAASTAAASTPITVAPGDDAPTVATGARGTVTADLWRGFAEGASPGGRLHAPSLTDHVPASTTRGPWVGLLGAGLMALGGMGIAISLRRRRALPSNAHR